MDARGVFVRLVFRKLRVHQVVGKVALDVLHCRWSRDAKGLRYVGDNVLVRVLNKDAGPRIL